MLIPLWEYLVDSQANPYRGADITKIEKKENIHFQLPKINSNHPKDIERSKGNILLSYLQIFILFHFSVPIYKHFLKPCSY
jgi:hypothetical protein